MRPRRALRYICHIDCVMDCVNVCNNMYMYRCLTISELCPTREKGGKGRDMQCVCVCVCVCVRERERERERERTCCIII